MTVTKITHVYLYWHERFHKRAHVHQGPGQFKAVHASP